jgi:hypothetical protein
MGQGKFQNSVYSTTYKGHKDSLYDKYFRKTLSGYLSSVFKGIFRALKQVRNPLRVDKVSKSRVTKVQGLL